MQAYVQTVFLTNIYVYICVCVCLLCMCMCHVDPMTVYSNRAITIYRCWLDYTGPFMTNI